MLTQSIASPPHSLWTLRKIGKKVETTDAYFWNKMKILIIYKETYFPSVANVIQNDTICLLFRSGVSISPGIFVPYNAQATLHSKEVAIQCFIHSNCIYSWNMWQLPLSNNNHLPFSKGLLCPSSSDNCSWSGLRYLAFLFFTGLSTRFVIFGCHQ